MLLMSTVNISVITSLYRCEKFLKQFLHHYAAIENIDECELILVHNDPTDKELQIIEEFEWGALKKKHIKIPREKLYASWNRAIREAEGMYMAVWNVDDIRTPRSLLSQKNALANSTAALCYGDFYGTSTYGFYKDRFFQYPEFDHFKKGALRHHVIGCFPMWKKEIHDQVGYFDEQFRLISDYEFQLRVVANYRMVKATEILGYYLEYQDHKLSSNHLLQDTERAVVEFRYRYYDKVLMHTLPFMMKYRISHFQNFGAWYKAVDVVPKLASFHSSDVFNFIQMPFQYFLTFSRRSINKIYRMVFQKA